MREETIDKSKYIVSTVPNLRAKSPTALRTNNILKHDHTLLDRGPLFGVFLYHGLHERLHKPEAELFAYVKFGLTLKVGILAHVEYK
jgi:hypothetical protein